MTNINTVPRKHITSYPVGQNILNKKHNQEWQNATNVTQFEYFGGNFEFSSSINKGATIKPLEFLEKKLIAALVLATQIWPWPCVNFCWLHPLKKNICPLSMKRKCLPSIHEKKMSALCAWYYHGSRTDLVFLSWSCSGLDEEMSVAKFELHWSSVT